MKEARPLGAFLGAAAVLASGLVLTPFLSLSSERFGWEKFAQVYAEDVAVPATARVQGRGAFFTSRVVVFDAGSSPLEVQVTYTPRNDFSGQTLTTTLQLDPGIQLEVDDPLAAWFGFGGPGMAGGTVGSLILQVTSGDPNALMVETVVFAHNDDGSEYGQFFPALRVGDALQAGEHAYLPTTVDAQAYRVNVGLMAVEDGTRVVVTPVEPIGTTLAGGHTINLDRGGNAQLNNIANVFGIGARSDILVRLDVIQGAVLGYASVLDGNQSYPGTSDPTTLLPVRDGAPKITLLELGPIQGLDEFSGSASLTNFSSQQAQVRVDYYRRGQSGITGTETLTVDPGGTVGYVDFVGDLFNVTNEVGALVLTPENGTMVSATGREFAIFRDGQGVIDGTAGQAIPGMRDDELLETGRTYHLLGLRDFQGNVARERSHIAAFNPGTSNGRMTVRQFDGATGAMEGQVVRTVRAGELIQINGILNVINPSQDGAVKRLEVELDTPMFVKAFRVNQYGDPITIPALAQP